MRSLLFVPADSPRKIRKALNAAPEHRADVIILDLEDSVSPDSKTEARRIAAQALAQRHEAPPSPGMEIYVRVNALDTELTEDDLAAVLDHGPDGLMLPKAEGGEDVAKLAAMAPQVTKIIAIATETPRAVFRLGTYDQAGSCLTGLTWGAEDLSTALGASASRDHDGCFLGPYQLARNLCLIAARAAGALAIDTVFTNINDHTGLERECRTAARDGFIGKMAIHPAQIEIINRIFTPCPEDLRKAQQILDAFAQATHAGVVTVDGKMVDRPHLQWAERVLAQK